MQMSLVDRRAFMQRAALAALAMQLPAVVAAERQGESVNKIIVSEFVTLDGIMEAPGGEPGHPHSGWVRDFMGPDQMQYKLDEILAAESLLLGRLTYESFAESWPQRAEDGNRGDRDVAGAGDAQIKRFADKLNAMPKHVVSTSLRTPAWHNTHVIDADVIGSVRRLKRQARGPILVHGSRTLVHALIEHDLVDEFRLMTFPVLLGSGRRMFPEGARKSVLKLKPGEVRALGPDVVLQVYKHA